MDPRELLIKRFPFASLKTRQRLLLWNCSNGKGFFGTPGRISDFSPKDDLLSAARFSRPLSRLNKFILKFLTKLFFVENKHSIVQFL